MEQQSYEQKFELWPEHNWLWKDKLSKDTLEMCYLTLQVT